jgi:hypothetical protein
MILIVLSFLRRHIIIRFLMMITVLFWLRRLVMIVKTTVLLKVMLTMAFSMSNAMVIPLSVLERTISLVLEITHLSS